MEIGLNFETPGKIPAPNQEICSHAGGIFAVLNNEEEAPDDPLILQQIKEGKYTTRITVTTGPIGSIFCYGSITEAVTEGTAPD